MLRHSFAMHTLERLVRGYYQRAAKLVVDAGGDDALALYLTKADPLLVLRDLLGHASVTTTQAYLHLLDTQRIYRDAYASAAPNPVVDDTDEPATDSCTHESCCGPMIVKCLEPAQPDLDLDVIHGGFPFSASARSADARRGCGGGVVGQGRRAAPGVARPIGVDFRGSAAEEKLGPIGWATPGAASLERTAPAPTNSEGFSEPTPTTDRAVNAIGSVSGRATKGVSPSSRSQVMMAPRTTGPR
jgi:hypothetical protein